MGPCCADGRDGEDLESLLAALDRQKADLRRQARRELWESQAGSRRAELRRRALEDPVPLEQALKASTMPGSAKYSFGMPRHLKGPFKITTLNPRDEGYVHKPGGLCVPGAGQYDPPQVDGRRHEDTIGIQATGGWQAERHSIFMRTLASFGGRASPDFFDSVSHRLGGDTCVPRPEIIAHVRWLASHRRALGRKSRRVNRWVEEHSSQFPASGAVEAQEIELAEEVRAAQELLRQADAEGERWGNKYHRQEPTAVPGQCSQGEVLDANLRGHPEYCKSPGYTFGASRELRDGQTRRYTPLTHVRSDSHLSNVGPGHFMGQEPPASTMRKSPSFTFGTSRSSVTKEERDAAADARWKIGKPDHTPVNAWEQVSRNLRVTSHRSPSFTFGKEGQRVMVNSNEMHVIRDKCSTPKSMGPGSFRHSQCMLSQF